MQHPDEGTIHAWLDGALSESEAAALETHVAACAECAERVREARGLVAGASRIVATTDWGVGAGVSDAPRRDFAGTSPRPRRRFFTPMRSAAAAVVLLAAGTLLVARQAEQGRVEQRSVTTEVAARHPAVVAPAPAAVPAPAYMPPAVARGSAAPERSATPARSMAAVRPNNAAAPGAASAAAADIQIAKAPDEPRPPVQLVDTAPTARTGFGALDAVAAKAAPARAPGEARRRPDALRLEHVAATGATAETSAGATSATRDARLSAPAPASAPTANAFAPGASSSVVRCYELVGDSAVAGIPHRFVLEPRGVVRGADGAILSTATWREARPTWMDVVFGSETGSRVLHIVDAGGNARGLVGDGERGVWVGVRRCE